MFASRLPTLALGAALALTLLGNLACERTAAASKPQQRVEIKVSKDGYTPAEVRAEAGRPLTLVFTRVDANNCGEKVVFPERDIKKTLPVGEAVEVSLTPKANERIVFTCGMGMYKGAVVAVSSGS
ncbi:MAG: cupredoxin domain-containing protein [Deltaproteobacteria bacterium]|nr:cupredoxin domain-containing protein [Deltaproteobacteria bacterium]